MMMLSSKKLFVIMLLLSSMAISCRKDLDAIGPKTVTQNAEPNKTSELKVAEYFNWETSNEIDFEITPAKSGLLLIQGENAEVFHKAFVLAGTNYNPKFSVQNKFTKLIVFFNGKQEKFALTTKLKIKSNLK